MTYSTYCLDRQFLDKPDYFCYNLKEFKLKFWINYALAYHMIE